MDGTRMTQIFRVGPLDRAQWVMPPPGTFPNLHGKLRDGSLAADWTPLAIETLRVDQGNQLEPVDLPWFAGFGLALTEEARGLLTEVLPTNGVLLPLRHPEMTMTLFVPPTEEVLDLSRSEVIRLPSGGAMDIRSYEFHTSTLDHVTIFRLPQLPIGPMFATDRFVKGLHESALTGLTLSPVWSG